MHILAFHDDLFGAADIFADIAGDTEAPFCAKFLALGFDDLGVDHGDLVVFKFGDKKTNGLCYLWRCQAHPACRVHRLEHLVRQLLDGGVEVVNLFGFPAQYRIFCCYDFEIWHKCCFSCLSSHGAATYHMLLPGELVPIWGVDAQWVIVVVYPITLGDEFLEDRARFMRNWP